MPIPTAAERSAFAWMQGRMVDLLLRHDAPRFDRIFLDQPADPYNDPRLAYFRELAVLRYLRRELFDSILPRIRARLSFAAPRELRIEDPPPRGRVDWGRTIAASWRDRPGEVPLAVVTRQRRRHFATPANVLTVCTLVQYRTAVERCLHAESSLRGSELLRHPLHEIIEASTRELSTPPFAGLVPDATRVLEDLTGRAVAELEEQVAGHLAAGRNSAYDELLSWRRRLHSLALLDRTRLLPAASMLGAEPKRDNYLYQLWVFYEFVDLLCLRGCLHSGPGRQGVVTFTWGAGDDQRTYRLQHDQVIAGNADAWTDAPGVRPDFYIAHVEPEVVRDGSVVTWHEPGYLLDAKFYRPTGDEKAPAEPVKRMIADLQLTGERFGALLFAFLEGGRLHAQLDDLVAGKEAESVRSGLRYTVRPSRAVDQAISPDMAVAVWQMQPVLGGTETIQQVLITLLDAIHARLHDRVVPRCQATFFDTLGKTAHGDLPGEAGLRGFGNGPPAESGIPASDLLLCPKVHIAPGYAEVVSRERDCLKSARCHVRGRAHMEPERIFTLKQIKKALHEGGHTGDRERVTALVTQQFEIITRRYADLIEINLKDYQERVMQELNVLDDIDLAPAFRDSPLLNQQQRETLGLALFLEEQIDRVRASNYAGPALLYTGALESAINMSIYPLIPKEEWTTDEGDTLPVTLGPLGKSKGNDGEYSDKNYRLLDRLVSQGGHWEADLRTREEITLTNGG